MTAESTLEMLIANLRKSTSGLEQLKIIARAWATVRRLSRKERIELATYIGLEEAKTLLERFGQPGGVSPARLAEAVLKAERANPGELNRLLGDLRDSSKRAEALRETVRLAEASLAEPEPEPPPQPETAVPPPLAPSLVKEVSDREAAPPAPPKAPPLKPPAESAQSLPAVSTAAEAARKASPRTAAAPVLAVKEQPPEKPPEAPPPEVVESPWKAAPPSAPTPQIAKAPAAPVSLKPTDEAVALEAAPALTERFRLLNNLAREGALAEEDIETVVQAFPPGWPRRRALSALIRTGAVRNLDRILAALSQLTNPRDEVWCVSALARSRHLTPAELEKLMAGVSHDSSRRLLKRMFRPHPPDRAVTEGRASDKKLSSSR